MILTLLIYGVRGKVDKDCKDVDLGYTCVSHCEDQFFDCDQGCVTEDGFIDTQCARACLEVLQDCEYNCPCNKNCPNGCPCLEQDENLYCFCQDLIQCGNEENCPVDFGCFWIPEDTEECYDIVFTGCYTESNYTLDAGYCPAAIEKCPAGDIDDKEDCLLNNCSWCSGECRNRDAELVTETVFDFIAFNPRDPGFLTVPDLDHVKIQITYDFGSDLVVDTIMSEIEIVKDDLFTVSRDQKCSFTYQGRMFFAGGADKHQRLLFEFKNDKIVKLPDLPFDFVDGKCLSDDRTVLFCSSKTDQQLCFEWDFDSNLTEFSPSRASHYIGGLAHFGYEGSD